MRAGRRMERLVLLPFTIGCVSESSIAIANHHHIHHPRSRSRSSSSNPLTTTKNNNKSPPQSTIRKRLEDDDHSLSSNDDDTKLPISNISAGFHRFLKSFKSTFVNNGDDEEEEMEEEGIMEIGLPTDVKHVTHIGFDDHEAISSSSSSSASLHSTGVDQRPSILCQCGGWENLSGPQSHNHHRQLLCLHHSSSSFVRPEQLPLASPGASDPVHSVFPTSSCKDREETQKCDMTVICEEYSALKYISQLPFSGYRDEELANSTARFIWDMSD